MTKRIIRLLFIFTFLVFSSASFSKGASSYTTMEEFISMNKGEAELMSGFSKIVSSKSKPLRKRMERDIKIAVIYPAIQKSGYWKDSVKSMEERLRELNIRYNLYKYYSKPHGDYRLQVFQLSEALKEEMDYISLSADNENIKRLVSGLLTREEPKIFIQNLTTPLKGWEENPPLMYVGFDHIEGSKLIADHYSKLFPKGGKYIMLYGSKGTVSTLRGGGFENYGMSKGFVAVSKFYTDFSSEKAYKAVISSLKEDRSISFIYACSTDIAIGASKAVEELGLTGKVIVNGWGGTTQELRLIQDKKLDFTVMRMNDDNGVAIAEAIKLDQMGASAKNPKIFSGEFATVTSEMSTSVIDKLIERALRYSGN